MTNETFTLDGLAADAPALLPRAISDNIWNKVQAASLVPGLSTQTPVILGENGVAHVTARPQAGIVGENEAAPGSKIKLGAKTFKPVTASVMVELSKRAIKTNPVGVLGILEKELAGAVARQVDLAVFHGRAANTGALLTGGSPFLSQATNRVELTGAKNADKEIWDGYGLVIAGESTDFTGFAWDPRLVAMLANARDTQGRRLNPDINMGGGISNYSGQRVGISKSVSGQVDSSVDTGIRGIGGDWDSLRFGFNDQITITPIPYGDPMGTGDVAARGAVVYKAEVTFGWTVMDLNSFVIYENKVADVEA
ncbi:MAG TPA: phage major capsid protein [Arthrobacter sp.]